MRLRHCRRDLDRETADVKVSDLLDNVPDGLSPELQELMRMELNVCADWERAEKLLRGARRALPEQIEFCQALYKMYAYTGRFTEALELINTALTLAADRLGCQADWRLVSPTDPAFREIAGVARAYLYSLKAAGFVYLRQANVDDANAVLAKLAQLDPTDEVGGSVVRAIALSLAEELPIDV